MAKAEVSKHDGDDYKKMSRNLYVIVGLEILCTIVLSFILYFGLIRKEWYQPYIDSTIASWEKGPIVELRLITKDEDCDKETMVKYMTAEATTNPDGDSTDNDATFGWGNGKFEIVG